jgi:hypothetical protein
VAGLRKGRMSMLLGISRVRQCGHAMLPVCLLYLLAPGKHSARTQDKDKVG